MISAKQFKVILDSAFSGAPVLNFTPPTATFTVVPTNYSVANIPVSLSFSGAITSNQGTNITWSIIRVSDNTVVAAGNGNSVSSLVSSNIPNLPGSYKYKLSVAYRYNNVPQTNIDKYVDVLVYANAYVGQLSGPSADINTVGDLTPAILSTLTTKSFQEVANWFPIVSNVTARIIFVIPNSFGALDRIEDSDDNSVLNEFNVLDDSANSRKIYVAKLATSSSEGVIYKFVFI
jgi:hypothetical protein